MDGLFGLGEWGGGDERDVAGSATHTIACFVDRCLVDHPPLDGGLADDLPARPVGARLSDRFGRLVRPIRRRSRLDADRDARLTDSCRQHHADRPGVADLGDGVVQGAKRFGPDVVVHSGVDDTDDEQTGE